MSSLSAAAAAPSSIADAVLPTFAKGVLNLLAVWPALRLAVSHHWGGRQGVTDLAEDLVDLFYSTATDVEQPTPTTTATPDTDDIESVLLHVVEHAFNVSLEDGSEQTVARDLLALWNEAVARLAQPTDAQRQQPGLFEKFAAAADKAKAQDGAQPFAAQCARAPGDEADEDDDDDDDDDDDSNSDMEDAELAARGPAGDVEMDVDSTRQAHEPTVDEDGFTLVTKKSSRR
ncbi:hypothetical protein OIV83_005137 [Microbotryomycetes sp. JL201]|nr:hypothetical protein OIV83_005137 [Microbotryomycetes sp. JL201]